MAVDESPRSKAPWITLGLLLTFALALCVIMAWPFAGSILAGGALALLAHPIHQRINRRVKSRSLAASLATFAMLIAVLVPLIFIGFTVTKELQSAYSAFGQTAVNGGPERIWQTVQPMLSKVANWTGMSERELQTAISARLRDAGTFLLRYSLGLAGAAGSMVISLTVACATLFFALRDGEMTCRKAIAISPLGRDGTRLLFTAVQQSVTASFYGVAAVAVAQGVLCGIGLWIAGLPSPALWGVAAAIFSVLPLVGTALVWVPAAIVLFIEGSFGMGIFVLAWGGGLVGMVDNIVRPLVVTASVSANPLFVFIAMLGGVQAFGLLGILIGPVTLAVTAALFTILQDKMKVAGI